MGVLTAEYYSIDWKMIFYPVSMAVFYKTTGAFSHHIVLNLENIEVAVVQDNKTIMEHVFNLTLP